ncbi:hypothetical protein PILCRDRAFT_231180 [Piloderma croceum F 1598]|uniref:Uncharacterized protein n=1 Tax=Piloderma croceum (strain F 1598) TaxID=765440 RepID=A0A0C3CFR0_PILCF|nr:hypothetical protein PILCRDRAFT_231180 [Piloderma croceum F 1598]
MYAFAVRERHKAFADRTLITSLPIRGYLILHHLQPLTLYTHTSHTQNNYATPEAAPGPTVLATPPRTKLLAGTLTAPVVMVVLASPESASAK